jgi:hypothetical protein
MWELLEVILWYLLAFVISFLSPFAIVGFLYLWRDVVIPGVRDVLRSFRS